MGSAPDHKKPPQKPTPQWVIDQNNFQKNTKYPSCRGTFDDCPSEIDPNSVAHVCKMCPIYIEGKK